MSQQESGNQDSKDRGPGKLWVPIIVVIGIFMGVIVYLADSAIDQFNRIGFFFRQGLEFQIFQEFHIILSTVGIALLVALLVVYGRTYAKTKANFILGLLVVLFALLLQSLFTYPFFTDLLMQPQFVIGPSSPFPSNFSSPFADVFTIIAYAVFLYLSLE